MTFFFSPKIIILFAGMFFVTCGAAIAATLIPGHGNGCWVNVYDYQGGWKAHLIYTSNRGQHFDGRASVKIDQPVKQGSLYQISFNLRSEKDIHVNVDWKMAEPPFEWVGAQTSSSASFEVNQKEKNYSLYVRAVRDLPADKSSFNFYFGANPAHTVLYITNFTLQEIRPDIPLDLKTKANFGFEDDVAGDGKGGWSDQGSSNDFKNFPVGQQTFNHVAFNVINPKENNGRAILSFPSRFVRTNLREAPIVLPESRRYLYLLHTATFVPRTPENAVVGKVLMEGTVANVCEEIKAGERIGDWWNPISKKDAPVVYSASPNGTKVGVYLTCIPIPIGTNKITLQPAEGDANWIVVAATLSDIDYKDEPPATWQTSASPQWRPIPLKPYITPGSALDFTGKREVAGKYGRVFVRPQDGQLAFQEKPDEKVRFLGYNFVVHAILGYPVDWSKLPESEWKRAIDQYADGVAAAGINALRWHYIEHALINKFEKNDSGEKTIPVKPEDVPIDPLRLKMFFYLFTALKERGIYAEMDLGATKGGWTAFDPFYQGNPLAQNYHSILFYDPRMRANWRAGVKRLLTEVNPYTGLALKDDPALINVTYVNEQYFNWDQNICTAFEPEWQKWINQRHHTEKTWPSLSNMIAQSTDPISLEMSQFMQIKEGEMLDFFKNSVREFGYPGLVSNDMTYRISVIPTVASRLDAIAMHPYFDHPTYVNGIPFFSQTSEVGSMPPIMPYRFLDRPYFINEYNHVMPNRFRHESPLVYPVVLSLHNGSAFFPHAQGVWPKMHQMQPFFIAQDPLGRALMVLSYFSFLREDVAPGSKKAAVLLTKDDSLKYGETPLPYSFGDISWMMPFGMVYDDGSGKKLSPANRADIFIEPVTGSVREYGVANQENHRESLQSLVEIMRQRKIIPPENKTNVNQRIFESVTGEIEVYGKSNEMKVITPRLEMGAVKSDHAWEMNRFAILKSSIPAAFAAASLDAEKTLADSPRILLPVMTDALNTDMRFDSEKREGVLNQGTTPVLLECGNFHLSLKNNMKNPVLYALNCSGDRIAELPVEKRDGQLHLIVDTTKLPEPAVFFELTER